MPGAVAAVASGARSVAGRPFTGHGRPDGVPRFRPASAVGGAAAGAEAVSSGLTLEHWCRSSPGTRGGWPVVVSSVVGQPRWMSYPCSFVFRNRRSSSWPSGPCGAVRRWRPGPCIWHRARITPARSPEGRSKNTSKRRVDSHGSPTPRALRVQQVPSGRCRPLPPRRPAGRAGGADASGDALEQEVTLPPSRNGDRGGTAARGGARPPPPSAPPEQSTSRHAARESRRERILATAGVAT